MAEQITDFVKASNKAAALVGAAGRMGDSKQSWAAPRVSADPLCRFPSKRRVT